MKLSFDSYFDSGDEVQISGFFPGLVGLANRWFVKTWKYSAPVICNPSTGQLLHLTRVISRRDKSRSLFGYDPIDKQVKVLSMLGASYAAPNMMSEEYQLITLRTGKVVSQRMINCGRVLHCNPHVKEICINGVFYYPSVDMSTESYLLVCFDVRSEKFIFIKGDSFILMTGTMINYNGKLGLLWYEGWLSRSSASVNLCVLEDFEKREWSEHRYVLPALWADIVGSEELSFVGMTRENEIVMLSLAYPTRPLCLLYFNTERNTIVRVAIQGMDVSEYDKVHIFLDHVENVKFL